MRIIVFILFFIIGLSSYSQEFRHLKDVLAKNSVKELYITYEDFLTDYKYEFDVTGRIIKITEKIRLFENKYQTAEWIYTYMNDSSYLQSKDVYNVYLDPTKFHSNMQTTDTQFFHYSSMMFDFDNGWILLTNSKGDSSVLTKYYSSNNRIDSILVYENFKFKYGEGYIEYNKLDTLALKQVFNYTYLNDKKYIEREYAVEAGSRRNLELVTEFRKANTACLKYKRHYKNLKGRNTAKGSKPNYSDFNASEFYQLEFDGDLLVSIQEKKFKCSTCRLLNRSKCIKKFQVTKRFKI
jgi:hypothetical protein